MDEFSINDFLGEAVVLDVSSKYGPETCKSKPIQLEDLEVAAKQAGLQVNAGDMVLIHTGWHHLYYQDPLRYYRDYCALSAEAGAWLASRKVRLVGVDACDVDEHRFFEVPPPFFPPNHARNFLPNDIFIIENVGGEIDHVLNRRIDLIVAPLNLAGFYAASSPIRLIALAP